MKENKKIQLSRSSYIEESRQVAVIRLNEHEFLEGEPVIINYYKDNPDFQSRLGTLVAVGVKSGKGPDAYKLISTGITMTVRKVVTDPEDISGLVHDEIYVYHNLQEDNWYYVYLGTDGITRAFTKIPQGRFTFVESDSGYRWFYYNQSCRREDDFLSKQELQSVLIELHKNDIYLSVNVVGGNYFHIGETADVNLKIGLSHLSTGVDASKKCKFYINDKEISRNDQGITVVHGLTQDTDLTVRADYEMYPGFIFPYTKKAHIYFCHYIYYGFVREGWKPEVENIKNLPHQILHRKEEIKIKGDLNYQLIALAYPREFGEANYVFDDNHDDYLEDYEVYGKNNEIELDGTYYYVYLKKEPVIITRFLQNFKVSNGTSEEDVNSGILDELYQAWTDRNSSAGLLLLNKDGYVPDELINKNSIIFLEGLVDRVPDRVNATGLNYYSKATKKIYTSKSYDEFTHRDPSSDALYIDKENRIIYYWSGTDLVTFVENLKFGDTVNDLVDIIQ